jgi:hypothetical protein
LSLGERCGERRNRFTGAMHGRPPRQRVAG